MDRKQPGGEQPSGPVGLPYPAEKAPRAGHPWEQQTMPASKPPSRPLDGHGSLADSSWEQRAQQPIPFLRLVGVEWRKLTATTSELVQVIVASALLLVLTWLAATLVNQGGPTAPPYQLFGLVLAGHLAPVPLYAVVLRIFSGEWYYRSVELTMLYQPGRLRNASAQLVAVLALWPVVAVAQFAVYFPAKPALGGQPLWVLGIALLTTLISLLVALAVTLLIPNPTVAVLGYAVLSVLYLARLQNPLVLRFLDPWQPASLLAGAVREPIPTITSAAMLLAVLGVGCLVAARR